jgi:hypothetical protein
MHTVRYNVKIQSLQCWIQKYIAIVLSCKWLALSCGCICFASFNLWLEFQDEYGKRVNHFYSILSGIKTSIKHSNSMQNIVLKICKKNSKATTKELAALLKITQGQYAEIERGNLLMTKRQAAVLGKFLKVKGSDIYESAIQLDLFLIKAAIIDQLKETIEELGRTVRENNRQIQILYESKNLRKNNNLSIT